MVFIMPASVIVKLFYSLGWLILLISPLVHAGNFTITSAQVNKIGNGYVLNANINYPLTPRVIEAIENGVPITFVQQLELVHEIPILGKYWHWKQTQWSTELRYELRYHALAQQYVLLSSGTHNRRNFTTLNDALRALGLIVNLALPPEHLSDLDNLKLYLRTELDIHALPTPMRPGALLSSKWQLASPWVNIKWF
ncbi:MAG: hypothetical protein COB23_01120 [Methylophaga sp.]|nr:MAG: hypothetical protein COB23_01120 [Methylophaga sp.]